MILKSFFRFILRVEKYESRLLEGIKANEKVEVRSKHYDCLCNHKVVWEDIYNVYHLANEGSEESIKKLQRDYQIIDEGHSVYVKLRTPIFDEKPNNDYYHTFTIEEIKSFYYEALKHKELKIKWEKEKHEREVELTRKNETKNLTETVNKIMKE